MSAVAEGSGSTVGARSRTRSGWRVVVLLSLFMLINFLDKAIIGLAGVPIMHELGLSPAQFGLLGSSFFFLFAISAVLTGLLVHRIGTRWVILGMALIWSLAQFPMVGTVTFSTLMACRILLGAGEGPAYPTALHAVYNCFPNERRGLPSAIVALGASAGIIAAPALTYVIVHVSWHWAFGALGLIGLAWSFGWLVWGYEGKMAPPIRRYEVHGISRVPYWRLLTSRTTIATIATGFAAYSGLSLLLVWFTPYLVLGLGFAPQTAGSLTALPPAGSALVMAVAGWASQRAQLAGATTTLARGVLTATGVLLGGAAICAIPFCGSSGIKVALMVLGVALPSGIYVLAHPMISEYTPMPQRAPMLCIVNSLITLAGVIMPFAMGQIVAHGETPMLGYERGFLVCGLVTLIGGIIGLLGLRPEATLAHFAGEHQPTAP